MGTKLQFVLRSSSCNITLINIVQTGGSGCIFPPSTLQHLIFVDIRKIQCAERRPLPQIHKVEPSDYIPCPRLPAIITAAQFLSAFIKIHQNANSPTSTCSCGGQYRFRIYLRMVTRPGLLS
ncbi:hypothetical protein WAI453_005521 [Rhynchosporium graminicola]